MLTSFCDLKRKDVVSIKDGTNLGSVGDIEIDTKNCKILSIVIFGKLRWFGLLGKEDDIVIEWSNISIIGEDTILVNYEKHAAIRHRKKFDI